MNDDICHIIYMRLKVAIRFYLTSCGLTYCMSRHKGKSARI